MRDFRRRPEVQAFVEQHTLAGRSASAIIRSMQEEFGRGYRRQDVLADMRKIQERVLDVERAQKAIPRKYRKAVDPREHLLIYRDSFLAVKDEAIQLRARGVGTVKQEVEAFRRLSQRRGIEKQKFYYKIYLFVGTKENLESKLETAREAAHIDRWALVPSSDSARVFNLLSQFALDRDTTPPWLNDLQMAAELSRTPSFQKLVKQVLS